ncbi:uncharacterized protein G2W53_008252 [Senna tora]|uniref:Uncharacterized protein n=1 Tax=Senna tora TaxID=362788 RepID=A0A834X838_9FABA|nr:uncharacterized protein G2W53_008252 [Senna tora]
MPNPPDMMILTKQPPPGFDLKQLLIKGFAEIYPLKFDDNRVKTVFQPPRRATKGSIANRKRVFWTLDRREQHGLTMALANDLAAT